jgi:AraC-like DNA-binding protein
MLPPKSKMQVRLLNGADNQNLQVEVENTTINLIRVNEVCAQTLYSFAVQPLANGTLYLLSLAWNHKASTGNELVQTNTSGNNLPPFYVEIQRRLRAHFTQADKLIAALAQNQPHEAAFMQKVNALINANLQKESFDTNALCKAMSMSRTQLFRRVKFLIRQAPAHHIKNMRLQRAKELLETTDLTVSEIAFKTGFQTASHFTKIFQKQYGILPSVFRRDNTPATNE